MSNANKVQEAHSPMFLIFLLATALICGAQVMVVEVLGSRVISPFFGASLFIWTSLIAVTLVGLALGYMAGGGLSDLYESPAYLYTIIFLAGIVIYCIPILKKPVFELTVPLGLRFGALTASALLFGVPHFLLGCVSPYIIRIAAKEMQKLGRTVGLFYAVSTIGSFFGTILTGFFLISFFKVNQIFAIISLILILLSVIFFIFFRKRYLFFVLLVVPVLLPSAKDIRTMSPYYGQTITKMYDHDTFYGNIKVIETSYPNNMRIREMLLDGAIQGGIDVANGMPVYNYYYYLQYIPFSLNAQGKYCLVMGLGTGIIPLWYEKMGIQTDVVDINPEVFAVAKKYFGFHTKGENIVADARYFLSLTKKKYDYIILDVFNGDALPEHLLSLESFELISQHLNDRGILGINYVGSIKHDTFITSSIVKTLRTVFSTVEIFPTFDPENPYSQNFGIGNLEIFAYNFPSAPLNRKQLQSFPFHPQASSARDNIGIKFSFPYGTPGTILTDNYDPIDTLDLRVKEEIRKRVLASTPIEMLL
ncbi:MAG TPA: fused MFS/spermidine synthase [Nitrospirota bacterium]|nr:fused MFS/spermidine synthase [Nitrospirota bacterium]